MRKTIASILIMSMMVLLLSACGKSAGREEQSLHLRIIDGAGTGSLILAGDQVYQLPTEGLEITVAGKKGSLDVAYSGLVEETIPARISGARSLSVPTSRKSMTRSTDGAFYDLCSLYLKVLDTLWYDNTELNDDIEYISVDLSDAPGSLTAAERSAIAWVFASRHKAVPLELSINELMDTGYIHLSDGIMDCCSPFPPAYRPLHWGPFPSKRPNGAAETGQSITKTASPMHRKMVPGPALLSDPAPERDSFLTFSEKPVEYTTQDGPSHRR